MIGQIFGKVLEKTTHNLVLDVNGVGYEIDVPISTAFELPDLGNEIRLFTHFVVREDAQLLFGFLRRADRDTFRTLIKVNGVGPKLGIAILSGLDAKSLAYCVERDDVSALVKLPGIGKKTAERLLIELRDKIKVEPEGGELELGSLAPATTEETAEAEAESALLALGYKPAEASRMIKAVFSEGMSVEALLKAALKRV